MSVFRPVSTLPRQAEAARQDGAVFSDHIVKIRLYRQWVSPDQLSAAHFFKRILQAVGTDPSVLERGEVIAPALCAHNGCAQSFLAVIPVSEHSIRDRDYRENAEHPADCIILIRSGHCRIFCKSQADKPVRRRETAGQTETSSRTVSKA